MFARVVLTWLEGFGSGKKFAVYCSDVSGAFDKVQSDRLVAKLDAIGVPSQMLKVLSSWLEKRKAHVVVEGNSPRRCR